MTPREVDGITRAKRAETLERARARRYETAIVCTYLAKIFGGKKSLTVKAVYEGMKIRDPEEEAARPRYPGTLRQQMEAHERYLEERDNAGHQ